MTTLLYRVCKDDADIFEEATRLVKLFIEEALANKEKADDRT